MKIKPDIVYKVIKSNTDGCIQSGDLIFIDSKTGQLISQYGFLNPSELTNDVMDFDAYIVNNYQVIKTKNTIFLKKISVKKCILK